MSILLRVGQLTSFFLIFAGLYFTHILLFKNGTVGLLEHLRDNGPRNLPGTKEPLRLVYTGIKKIDYRLTVLETIFWPISHGSHPYLSLQAFYFVGQVAGAWGLVMLEGTRSGNKGRIVS